MLMGKVWRKKDTAMFAWHELKTFEYIEVEIMSKGRETMKKFY